MFHLLCVSNSLCNSALLSSPLLPTIFFLLSSFNFFLPPSVYISLHLIFLFLRVSLSLSPRLSLSYPSSLPPEFVLIKEGYMKWKTQLKHGKQRGNFKTQAQERVKLKIFFCSSSSVQILSDCFLFPLTWRRRRTARSLNFFNGIKC